MNDVLKQISVNLGVTGYDDSSILIGIADYYGVNTTISNSLMGDILDAVGGNAATSNNYIQDIVIALGGPSTSLNWIEEWEAITAPPPVLFTTEWTTTASSESIQLPYGTGVYTGTIDWGDGNTDVNDGSITTHTYATAGTYTVIIDGDCTGWYFGNTGGSTYITSVVNWGQLQLGPDNAGYNFAFCPNLDLSSVSDTLDLTGVTVLDSLFDGCTSLTTINNINSWDTSVITSMNSMFLGCTSFNQTLSFDTSAVEYMSRMFSGCSVFNQPLSFNTSSVTDMSRMFRDATAFNQNISSWNTSAVTDMYQMFQDATAFNQNIATWNVANVANFTNFMTGKTPATFSTTNLNAIYNGWSAQAVQSSLNISFGTAKYTAAATAGRAILTGTALWTITDGGL
jgi:surface protein